MDIYPKEMETYVHTKTSVLLFIVALFVIVRNWKELNLFWKQVNGLHCSTSVPWNATQPSEGSNWWCRYHLVWISRARSSKPEEAHALLAFLGHSQMTEEMDDCAGELEKKVDTWSLSYKVRQMERVQNIVRSCRREIMNILKLRKLTDISGGGISKSTK